MGIQPNIIWPATQIMVHLRHQLIVLTTNLMENDYLNYLIARNLGDTIRMAETWRICVWAALTCRKKMISSEGTREISPFRWVKAAQNSAVSSSLNHEKKPSTERKEREAQGFACPPVRGVTFWPPKKWQDKPIENGLKCFRTLNLRRRNNETLVKIDILHYSV